MEALHEQLSEWTLALAANVLAHPHLRIAIPESRLLSTVLRVRRHVPVECHAQHRRPQLRGGVQHSRNRARMVQSDAAGETSVHRGGDCGVHTASFARLAE